MAELRESSGLLSLASLHEHAQQRTRDEARAARAQAEAEQRARRVAEREAVRSDEERRRRERAESDLAASHEALLRARLDAERRTDSERVAALGQMCEELKATLHGERAAWRGAELALTSKWLRQRLRTALSLALCLGSWVGAIAWYFGALRPTASHALLSAQQALSSERRARGEVELSRARLVTEKAELGARLDSLALALRERTSSSASVAPQNTRPGMAHRPVRPVAMAAHPPPLCRDDGDPLNPCLKR